LFGEALALKPDWCMGKDLLHRKIRKHITEIKKALILWVSRGQSKPWSGLAVSTMSHLDNTSFLSL